MKMRQKIILKVFGCYLVVIENKSQKNSVLFFATYARINTVTKIQKKRIDN